MMTSREIVRRVLTFDSPPRIGLTLPDPYGNDLCLHGIEPAPNYRPREYPPQGREKWRRQDEWGSIWASLTDYDSGEVVQPAITDWSQLDSYRPPDFGDPARYRGMRERFAKEREKLRVGFLPGFVFAVARYIRKLENYLCDLLLERANIDRLHAIVRGQLLAAIERVAEAGADAVMFCEDWGTQERLMVSPTMWREIFRPEFAALCGAARGHGLFVLMHSCGKITDIIPDLIEVGISCLQFDQPRLHGIDRLAEFAGRVSFWCPVDIQTTLQTHDPVKIRQEARELVTKLGGKGGGFLAGYYPSNQAIGLTDDVQEHACMAFTEFAKYPGGRAGEQESR